MLFSVLMAHYNNARFLEQSITSVLSQSHTNWEIVLVDDGSTDEFETVVNAFKNEARIKVFRNGKNRGCAFTKRKCIEKAAGELAGFLDPDDRLHPDAIRTMVEAHTQQPACSIIHSNHYVCDQALSIIRIAEYVKALPPYTPYLLLNDGRVHHFATFKKTCYQHTRGISYPKQIDKAIDQDLYYLLEEEGDIFFIDHPLYYYRIHEGGISTMGKEGLTTMAHYATIEAACLRRIEKLKESDQPDKKNWIKKYRTRYYKIRIFNSFRRKQWGKFSISLLVFPFVGGMQNLLQYCRKLPTEGIALLKKSFATDYKIVE
ncbi:glycosyltransferase [Ferruginibacter paludis]|uniref:glycosyltransferase n=1 Tax=Ferruginibacter paludis TaxID=1310417 RepID=UPI0025B51AEF|nr:glycosyltransferase [Ferruginibacter paludis]MDN3656764.1 glycosyltransferase [Ferruginibacter paludis]